MIAGGLINAKPREGTLISTHIPIRGHESKFFVPYSGIESHRSSFFPSAIRFRTASHSMPKLLTPPPLLRPSNPSLRLRPGCGVPKQIKLYRQFYPSFKHLCCKQISLSIFFAYHQLWNVAQTTGITTVYRRRRRKRKKIQPWVTNEVLDLCDQRRQLEQQKYTSTEAGLQYRKVNREVRKKIC